MTTKTLTANDNSLTTPDSILDSNEQVTNAPQNRPPSSRLSGVAITLIVGVLAFGLLGGFVAGMQYGKSSGSSSNAAFGNQSQNGGPGGMGQAGMRGGFGTVTAVDSDSITVKDQMQGSSTTYSITDSTTVTDDGTTASISDIAVGDTVMVRTASSSSTSSSTTASSIVINPSMQGGPSSQTQSQSSSSTI